MDQQTPVVIGATSTFEKQTNITNVIDANHPYYLQPSNSHGMTLVHSSFYGKGFPGLRRGNILMLKPLPSMDHAYYMLLQDENQIEVYVNAQIPSDSSSFMLANQGRNIQKTRNQTRLHGFPEDFQFPNQKGDGAQAKANAGIIEEVQENFVMQNESTAHGLMQFSKEQCTEIAKMVHKQMQLGKTSISNPEINAIACAGASEHMCFDSSSLSSLIALPVPVNINLPNSFRITVTHTGSVPILHNLTLKNVLYVLDFKYNLLSVTRLCIQIKDKFEVHVKRFTSDNALELGRGSLETIFLKEKGIFHQRSCTATPQQNRVVERKHRHLLELARGLFFQSKVPISYWGECILTATHLINRMPSKVLKGKSPYQMLFGRKPCYTSLESFGCPCYASTLSQDRGKFDERARKCVFLGYPTNQKGYKFLDLETKQILVSRDVHFHEETFPFMTDDPTSSTSHTHFTKPDISIDSDPQSFLHLPQSYPTPSETTTDHSISSHHPLHLKPRPVLTLHHHHHLILLLNHIIPILFLPEKVIDFPTNLSI
ncbi:uncharacterized protein LOC132620179 [Lycium barbarum]|uniref:uncharacterized protein LOC132620179 n=1 Tax=Lycium barbarum TaxID=112863 RepID=UPI00293EC7E2|nr:uncharacterized protein LOC132620179 [Lycium barbarum]